MNAHAGLDVPSGWVARFAGLIPPGEALDLACGAGRHSRLLAQLGLHVVAADRDAGMLASAAGPGIETVQVDLERNPPDPGADLLLASQRFTGVVVTNYLHRPLMSRLLDSLAPGGVLIYETFATGNGRFGKPSNPDFLLAPGELLMLLEQSGVSCRIVAFEDGFVEMPKPALVQRICARRSAADKGVDDPDPACLRLL
jgi:SAM-dependent methyltransferase